MSKQRLAIVGAGEMALQVLHYAQIDGRYDIVGYFVDDNTENSLENILPYLGILDHIEHVYNQNKFDCLFIAIGYKHLMFKENLHSRLKDKIPFATIIACPTYIDNTAQIGNDVIIYPGCIIDKDVIIEDNVLLNLGAKISHNTIVGNSSYIGVGVSLAGYVHVGSRCFLGTNSCTIDSVNLHDDIILGAGSIVVNDLLTSGVYVGAPSRKIH